MDIFYTVLGMNDGDFPNTGNCCYLHAVYMNFSPQQGKPSIDDKTRRFFYISFM
jgi:hypothetical protein